MFEPTDQYRIRLFCGSSLYDCSRGELVARLAAGAIDIEDLLLDVRTGEWAPLWEHGLVELPRGWHLLLRKYDQELRSRKRHVAEGRLSREEYLRERARLRDSLVSDGPMTVVGGIDGDPCRSNDQPDGWEARGVPGEIGEHYRFEQLLGSGGSGRVYLAVNKYTGKRVAIKLTAQGVDDARVRNELVALEQIKSRSVVAVRHYCPTSGSGGRQWLIVFEYVPGPTLGQFRLQSPSRRIEDPRIVEQVLKGIARGLADLHAHGLVHRDLKPANIIIQSDAAGPSGIWPVIIDLGMAKAGHNAGNTIVGGTPGYQSPEQEEGLPCSPASDVFAFGLIAYEMVTGKRMAGGKLLLLHEVCPGLPPTLDELVKTRCAHESVHERIRDGRELAQELERAFAGVPSSPVDPSAAQVAGRSDDPPRRPDRPAESTQRGSPDKPGSPVDEAIERGARLEAAGKIDEARDALESARRRSPEPALLALIALTRREIQRVRRRSGGTTSRSDENRLSRYLQEVALLNPKDHLAEFLAHSSACLDARAAARGIATIRSVEARGEPFDAEAAVRFLAKAALVRDFGEIDREFDELLAWATGQALERGRGILTASDLTYLTIQLGIRLAAGRGLNRDLRRAGEYLQSSEANPSGEGLAALAEYLRTNPAAEFPGIDRAEAAIRACKRGCPAGTRERGLLVLERWSRQGDASAASEAIQLLAKAAQDDDAVSLATLRRLLNAQGSGSISQAHRKLIHDECPGLRDERHEGTREAPQPATRTARAEPPQSSTVEASPSQPGSRGQPSDSAARWSLALRHSGLLTAATSASRYRAGLAELQTLRGKGNEFARTLILMESVHLFHERRFGFGPLRFGQSARTLEEFIVGSSSGSIEAVVRPALGRRTAAELNGIHEHCPADAPAEYRSLLEFLVAASMFAELDGRTRNPREVVKRLERSWSLHRSRFNAIGLWHCIEKNFGGIFRVDTPFVREVQEFVRRGAGS